MTTMQDDRIERFDGGLIQDGKCDWFDKLDQLIQGAPTKPLSEAAQCLEGKVYGWQKQMKDALRKASVVRTKMNDETVDLSKISDDEIAVVCWYTASGNSEETSMYRVLNKCLQEQRSQEQITPTLPLVKLLDDALIKLGRIPKFQVTNVTLYRGVKWRFPSPQTPNLEGSFPVGSVKLWPYFVSFSKDASMMTHFVGSAGDRTVFKLTVPPGVMATSIEAFSEYPHEREVLLRPLEKLLVVGVFDGQHTKSADAVLLMLEQTVSKLAGGGADTGPTMKKQKFEDPVLEEAKRGGVDGLLRCMNQNVGSAYMCIEICRMLCDLLSVEQSLPSTTTRSVIQAVLQCIATHPLSVAVCEQACWALRNMARDSANQVAIGQAGGIKAVLQCMAAHQSSACEAACDAFFSIIVNSTNKAAIAEAGGIDWMVKCIAARSTTSL